MEWVEFISKVGFPVVVAMFVLIRLNGKLEQLTVNVRELSARMEEFTNAMERILEVWSSKSNK